MLGNSPAPTSATMALFIRQYPERSHLAPCHVSSIFTSCFGIEFRFFSKYDRLK